MGLPFRREETPTYCGLVEDGELTQRPLLRDSSFRTDLSASTCQTEAHSAIRIAPRRRRHSGRPCRRPLPRSGLVHWRFGGVWHDERQRAGSEGEGTQ